MAKPRITKTLLREHGFFNSYDFAHARGELNSKYTLDRPVPQCRVYRENRIPPMITYMRGQRGRAYRAARWKITQWGVKTDPDAYWQDDGNKTFTVWGREDKDAKFAEALAWASDYFGVEEWRKEPFGALMPADYVDARMKQLQDWIEELKNEAA